MYIDIALTPAEETYLLSGFLILILLALVLLLRPRLFSRGLAPLLNFLKRKGLGAGVGSRRSSSSVGGAAGVGGMNGVFPLSMPSSKRDKESGTGRRSSSSYNLGSSLISRWNKRWQLIKKTIHDNPEDFGYGLASYWPIPTWSAWTTYPPILHWLEGVFNDELDLDLKKVSSAMDLEEEIVTPLEEGSRKGSVGLGIVGVDVVKPNANPNSSSRSNSLVDPAQGSLNLNSDIKKEEETREEDWTEEKIVRNGFFPVNYAMTAMTMTTEPTHPPTSNSTSTSTPMLGAREPRSPSSTDMKSPNPNQRSGLGLDLNMGMGRRFTASSLHPDDHPKSQFQSPNPDPDMLTTTTEMEPKLIPFTPFPKPLTSTSTSTSKNRSWASRARRLLLYTYTRLAGPVCLVAMGFALGVMVWQAGQSWGNVWRVVFGRGDHGISGEDVRAVQTGLGKRGVAEGQGFELEADSDEDYGYRPEGGNVVQALVSPTNLTSFFSTTRSIIDALSDGDAPFYVDSGMDSPVLSHRTYRGDLARRSNYSRGRACYRWSHVSPRVWRFVGNDVKAKEES